MSVKRIDHYAILVKDLNETIEFYTYLLGLIHGPKLNGGFGEFLYFPDSSQACIHLLSEEKARHVNNDKAEGFQVYATPAQTQNHLNNTHALDHIAFAADKAVYDEIMAKLKARNIPIRLGEELAPDILQVWFLDPNGIKVEVTYNKNNP